MSIYRIKIILRFDSIRNRRVHHMSAGSTWKTENDQISIMPQWIWKLLYVPSERTRYSVAEPSLSSPNPHPKGLIYHFLSRVELSFGALECWWQRRLQLQIRQPPTLRCLEKWGNSWFHDKLIRISVSYLFIHFVDHYEILDSKFLSSVYFLKMTDFFILSADKTEISAPNNESYNHYHFITPWNTTPR